VPSVKREPSSGPVGNDADALLCAEWEEFTLEFAKEHVVARLNRVEPHDPQRFAPANGTGDLVRGEVRAAHVPHFSRADNVFERTKCLVDRRLGIRSVELVEVDVVSPKPAKRCIDRVENVLA
jgi:hypothetical protein